MEQRIENEEKISISDGLLLAALTLVPTIFGTAFTRFEWLKSSTLLVLTGLAAIAWAIKVFKGKKVEWSNAKGGSLILGFGFFALLSLLWSPNLGFGLENALTWSSFSVLTLLFATSRNATFRQNIPVAVSLGSIIAGGLTLADFLGVEGFSKIWDAPGAAGAFDSVDQASTYFILTIGLLVFAFPKTEGWRRLFTIAGISCAALAFGSGASISLLHIAFLVLLVGVTWFQTKAISILAIAGLLGALIASTFFTIDRPDPSKTISNKLPVAHETRIVDISDIKSSKVQHTSFDINRIADTSLANAFQTLTNDFLSRGFTTNIIGEGAGSWWLVQKPNLPKREFKYYSVHRNSPGLPIFELGLLGLFFLVAFIASLLVSKDEDGKYGIQALPIFLMFVLAGLFSTLASVLVILACVVGIYATKDESTDFQFNNENTKAMSRILAIAILLSGLGFVAYGSFSGVARFHESRGDLLMLRKKYSSAAKAYEKAYNFSKLEPAVAYNYALSLKKIGQDELAAAPANTALQGKLNDARYLFLVSLLQLSKKGEDDKGNRQQFKYISEASEAVEKAIRLFPNYIDARKSLVLIQDLQGRRATANQSLNALVDLDPPAEVKRLAYSELGQSYTVLGKPKSALESYKKALVGEKDVHQKQSLSIRIKQIEAKIKEERLIREGKPIPEALKRQLEEHDHAGHDHQH